jgi:hypothetical protein
MSELRRATLRSQRFFVIRAITIFLLRDRVADKHCYSHLNPSATSVGFNKTNTGFVQAVRSKSANFINTTYKAFDFRRKLSANSETRVLLLLNKDGRVDGVLKRATAPHFSS